MIIGILSSVMSTISAFLSSISTLFTYDVYKKWIRKTADDKELVKIGTICTLVLMVFSIIYCPLIGKLGGIFQYFQSMATYLAVPVATVFLFGIFWKRATPAAALVVILAGIPLGVIINQFIIPHAFSPETIRQYSLNNFFVASGFNQLACVILMIGFSLFTRPKPEKEIAPLMWTKDMLHSPPDEPRRPFLQSVGFWWTALAAVYAIVYVVFW
jgi:SSS family solute:Na+ symporter